MSVPDGAILLSDYRSAVRMDFSSSVAQGSRGGCAKLRCSGVLFLIRNDVQFTFRPDLQIWPESVWIEVRLWSSSAMPALVISCLYRVPNQDPSAFAIDVEATVDRLDLTHSHLLLLGDFNAHCLAWYIEDS